MLVLLDAGRNLPAVMPNAQTGEFTRPSVGGDRDRFWTAIRTCLLVLAVFVPVHALGTTTPATTWASTGGAGSPTGSSAVIFAGRRYYRLGISDEIDNPDQRIAEDVECSFTQRRSSLPADRQWVVDAAGGLQQCAAVDLAEAGVFPAAYATVGTCACGWV